MYLLNKNHQWTEHAKGELNAPTQNCKGPVIIYHLGGGMRFLRGGGSLDFTFNEREITELS